MAMVVVKAKPTQRRGDSEGKGGKARIHCCAMAIRPQINEIVLGMAVKLGKSVCSHAMQIHLDLFIEIVSHPRPAPPDAGRLDLVTSAAMEPLQGISEMMARICPDGIANESNKMRGKVTLISE